MRLRPYLLLIFLAGWGLYLLLQNFCLGPNLVKNILFWFSQLFLLSLLSLVSLGLGEYILKKFKLPLIVVEKRLLAISLGLLLLGYIVFLLGVLKLYYFFTGYILIGLLFLGLWPSTRKNRKYNNPGYSPSLVERLIIISLGLSLLIILMGVLTPPLDYDDLEYHLGVPAQYIKAHGLVYLPHNVYSQFPLHLEMLNTLGLLLHGPILAKMVNFLFLLLVLVLTVIMGNKIYPKSGLLASLILVNIPIVAITSAKAYNDMGLTLFGLLAIYTLWLWAERKDKKFLILAAIFCGGSLAIKYTALIFFFAPLLAFILGVSLAKGKNSPKEARRSLGLFVFISLLVASPWYLKNLIYTGNPVFPLAYNQFGGRNWGEFEAQRFQKQHQVDLRDLQTVIEAPLKIIKGEEGDTGITVLLFLPFLFFIKGLPRAIKWLGLYGFFYFLIWTFFTHRMSRFLIPVLPLLSILASYSLYRIWQIKKYLGLSLSVFLFSGLLFNGSRLFYQFSLIHPLPFISGKDSEKEYLSKIFYLYPAIDFINTSLPPEARILFIAEARTFYGKKSFLVNTPLDKNIIVEIANKCKGPEDILKVLKEMGVTHVLYNATEARRINQSYQSFNWASPLAEKNFVEFMNSYVRIIFSQERVIIGELS